MTTLDRAYPVARKGHRCGSCAGRIHPGERYYRWTGTGDEWDGIGHMKECASCAARYCRPVPTPDEEVA